MFEEVDHNFGKSDDDIIQRKKCLFPLNAYMVLFPTSSKNLGRTLIVNVICLTVCHQTCLLPRLFMTNFALTSEFWIAILLLQLQSSFKQNRFNNVLLDNNRLGEIDRKTSMLSWTFQLLNMKDHLNFRIFLTLINAGFLVS